MKQNIDDYIEFFVSMIEQTNKKFENDEFLSKLYSQLSDKINVQSNFHFKEVNKFYKDIKRTRYFLKHIDKESWLEGLKYYKNVKRPELKIELAKDFKEMKIADRDNDIIEYTRRLVMQLENCLNSIIVIIDAYCVISSTPERYKDKYNDLRGPLLIDF